MSRMAFISQDKNSFILTLDCNDKIKKPNSQKNLTSWLTLSKVSSLRARLGNRHAEKLIPPHELENIQSLWDESNEREKCDIFAELDGYDREEIKRLFTLLARQSKSVFLLKLAPQLRDHIFDGK